MHVLASCIEFVRLGMCLGGEECFGVVNVAVEMVDNGLMNVRIVSGLGRRFDFTGFI